LRLLTYDIVVLIKNGQLNARNLSWEQNTGSNASNTSSDHCDLQSLAVSFDKIMRREGYLQLPNVIDRLLLDLEVRREWVHPIIIVLQRLYRWQVFSGDKINRGPCSLDVLLAEVRDSGRRIDGVSHRDGLAIEYFA
jgi:hypothetical protein